MAHLKYTRGTHQTITQTPWELAQLAVDRAERGHDTWLRTARKRNLDHGKHYEEAMAFNQAQGLWLVPKVNDPKRKYIRKATAFKSRRPITLPKVNLA